jgi:hypothetical protein
MHPNGRAAEVVQTNAFGSGFVNFITFFDAPARQTATRERRHFAMQGHGPSKFQSSGSSHVIGCSICSC